MNTAVFSAVLIFCGWIHVAITLRYCNFCYAVFYILLWITSWTNHFMLSSGNVSFLWPLANGNQLLHSSFVILLAVLRWVLFLYSIVNAVLFILALTCTIIVFIFLTFVSWLFVFLFTYIAFCRGHFLKSFSRRVSGLQSKYTLTWLPFKHVECWAIFNDLHLHRWGWFLRRVSLSTVLSKKYAVHFELICQCLCYI